MHELREVSTTVESIDRVSLGVLINGFKRYWCAHKLQLAPVVFISLDGDEAVGVMPQLIQMNGAQIPIGFVAGEIVG